MFDHLGFGVTDYAASKAFFLKALEPLGVGIVMEGEHGLALGQRASRRFGCSRRPTSRCRCTSRSPPRRVNRLKTFIARLSRRAARTTAHREFGRAITRTTTARS